MEMFLLDQMFFSFERCCVATASLVFTSRTDVPSSVILEPRYFKVFTDCSLLPLTVMGILVLLSLVAGMTLLFSALISIPKAGADLSSGSVSSESSFILPAIRSMSSAKRRLLMLGPPILTLPPKDSRASVITCSRKMLKRQVDSKHPCLTPKVVWNQSLMLLSTRTPQLVFSYSDPIRCTRLLWILCFFNVMCSLVFSIAAKLRQRGLSFEAVFCFSYKRSVFGKQSFKSCCKIRFDNDCCVKSYCYSSSEG